MAYCWPLDNLLFSIVNLTNFGTILVRYFKENQIDLE